MAPRGNVRVSITGDARGLQKATRDGEAALHRFSRNVGKGAAYALGAGGFGGGMYALFDVTRKAVEEFRESERVSKQTAAALKSTGAVAGVTAASISALATALSKKTAIDDEAIQSAENLLLTFTNVRNVVGKNNDIFNQATKATLDMSTALGQDFKSSAIQVGKALNDPIKGITALQRVGVTFTQQQKDQVAQLVKTGHALDAQKMILKELNTEFGGSAQKQATGFKRLQVTLGNLAEEAGRKLAPTIDRLSKNLDKFVQGMIDGTGAGGRFADTMKDVFGALTNLLKPLADIAKFLVKNPAWLKAAGAAWVAYKVIAIAQIAQIKIAASASFFGLGKGKGSAAEKAGSVAGKAFAAGFITLGLSQFADDFGVWLAKNLPSVSFKIKTKTFHFPGGFEATVPTGIGVKVGAPAGRETPDESVDFGKSGKGAPSYLDFVNPKLGRGGGKGGTTQMGTFNTGTAGGSGGGGGLVGKTIKGIPWAPGEEINASILPIATMLHKQYGVNISDAFDRDGSAGHKSPGHNKYGTAVDFTGTPAQTNAIAKWAVAQGFTTYYDGSFGTTPLAGHGPGQHIHVEFPRPGQAIPSVGQGASGEADTKPWKPCLLTWYDPGLGGINSGDGSKDPHHSTASGEPYMPNEMACAAPPNYAFGTMIEFLYGKKRVICRVNDRGGAIQGNHFDLTRGAARKLGLPGKANASFRVVGHRGRVTYNPASDAGDMPSASEIQGRIDTAANRRFRSSILPTLKGATRAGLAAGGFANAAERAANTGSIQERIAGLSDEDLTTESGRTHRRNELFIAVGNKSQELFSKNRQISALRTRVAKLRTAIEKTKNALRRAKSAGQRAYLKQILQDLKGRFNADRGTLRALGVEVADIKVDIMEIEQEASNLENAAPGSQLDNPWLVAALDNIDRHVAAGDLTQEQGNTEKTKILTGALPHLNADDTLTVRGIINGLKGEGGSVYGSIEERLAHINAEVRAGDLTPEQGQAAAIQTIRDNLGNPALSADEVLTLRGELNDLLKNNTDATNAATEATKALTDEIKRQNDYAASVSAVSLGAAWKALADVISGQIGGYPGVGGRALTAGAGSVARY